MLFNSEAFLLFLPCALLGYYWLESHGSRWQSRLWLVAASLFFYGWWNPAWVPILVGSAGFNFALGAVLARRARSAAGRRLLALGIAANLALLAWFKYTNFLLGNLDALTGSALQIAPIALPIGISFFTFQQIAYLLDAWRGETRESRFVDYLVFVTFFPQLIAGPIVHHAEMMPQFSRDEPERFRLSGLMVGVSIFSIGLFKKAVLADGVAPFAALPFDATVQGYEPTLLSAWSGTLAFTAQIYFDFSGYSDMAIGLGRMFGVHLPLNFDSPYRSRNIIEFWRRWHMTLSRFLRDCLYIPLGGNRRGRVRRHLNLMVVMLLGGLWHGAGWSFLVWGGLHGFYLMANHGWHAVLRSVGRDPAHSTLVGRGAARVLTFTAVVVAWVFFRAEDLGDALTMLRGLVGANGVVLPPSSVMHFDPEGLALTLVALGIAWWLPNSQQWMASFLDPPGPGIRRLAPRWRRLEWQPSAGWAVALGLVGVAALTSIWRPSVFLYFQF